MEFLSQNAALIGLIIMPFTYALVGWFTNWVALKMTFYPLKPFGWPPYLGWQGIVPRKSVYLALKSVQTITQHIIKVDEFFHKIDPAALTQAVHPLLHSAATEAFDQMGLELTKDWGAVDPKRKQAVLDRTEHETEKLVKENARLLKDDTAKVFNFKTFFVKNLTRDNSRLIVDLFIRIGSKEFRFIELSGLYFGFILGLGQVGLWEIYPALWTLPVQGVIVGYVTNWLALTMIFRPLYEKSYLGIKYQGLFLKRQKEVSAQYSAAVANEVLHPRKILEEVLYRRVALDLVKKLEGDIVELGGAKLADKAEEAWVEKITHQLSPATERMEKLLARAMNIESTMTKRMQEMPPEEFEPILRAAFKEDEYILILIGAVLGAIVGMGQMFYMISAGG